MSRAISVASVVVVATLIYFGGCNYNNVDRVKSQSTNTWSKAGFSIVSYEGYQIGNIYGNPGGKVWYVVERNGLVYEGFLSKWGDEYHIYCLKPLNLTTAEK